MPKSLKSDNFIKIYEKVMLIILRIYQNDKTCQKHAKTTNSTQNWQFYQNIWKSHAYNITNLPKCQNHAKITYFSLKTDDFIKICIILMLTILRIYQNDKNMPKSLIFHSFSMIFMTDSRSKHPFHAKTTPKTGYF